MATLYIDKPEITLKAEGDAIVIYHQNVRQKTIPCGMIERLIIQKNTALDTGTLLKLTEHGASVLLLSPRHSRKVAIILGAAHNEAQIRLNQTLAITDPKYSQQIAQKIILGKTQRQIQFLTRAQQERPDAHKPLHDALSQLTQIIQRITSDPPPSHATLRGYEGAAARAYFQGYAALLPPSLNFTGRNRRPARDPVNACLSLAYTLLHFDAVRAAHSAGLDPLLGFYHRPAFGRESLASDLIEPLRPHIDHWLWQQLRQRNLRIEHFSQDQQACLLNKTGREHFYPAWETFAPTHRRWLRQRASELAQQIKQRKQQTHQLTYDDEREE